MDTALLFYDYFLTFDLEYTHIWKGKTSLATLLFYANRYFSPIGMIFAVTAAFIPNASDSTYVPVLNSFAFADDPFPEHSCVWTEYFFFAFNVLSLFAGARMCHVSANQVVL